MGFLDMKWFVSSLIIICLPENGIFGSHLTSAHAATVLSSIAEENQDFSDIVSWYLSERSGESISDFRYATETPEGIKLGCSGELEGGFRSVSSFFIEDIHGERELTKFAQTTASFRNISNMEETKPIFLREFPENCFRLVFNGNGGGCPPGSPGKNGNQGAVGRAGSPGDKGVPGKAGVPGNDGPRGEDGPPGDIGLPGEQGDVGDNGLRGPQGPRGTGFRGPSGSNGEDGSSGDAGDTGDPGPDGTQGFPGANGFDGLSGRDGWAGPNGLAGEDGIDGVDGTPGTDGPDGICNATAI